MYRLYWAPQTASFIAELLLTEAGASFETIEVKERRAADFLALNPLAKLPVLRLPDGTVMTESAAIALHLCEAFPEAPFAPADSHDRAVAARWLLFCASELYVAYQQLYHSEHFTVGGRAAREEVKAAGRGRIRTLWQIFNRDALNPGPYVLGERYSVADAYALMLVSWDQAPEVLLLREPKLGALVEDLRARPEVAALLSKYRTF